MLDVGANIGTFTLAAARLTGIGGRVIAFEPSLEHASRLAGNLALNRYENVTTETLAVMDKDGEVSMDISAGGAQLARHPESSSGTVVVPCCRLDTYLTEHGLGQVDVVKIDVEGAEGFVVDGMEGLFDTGRYPAIVLEVHPDSLKVNGSSPEALIHQLEKHGYVVSSMEGTGEHFLLSHAGG